MNLRERIARRQRTEHEPRLVHDYDAVNPVVHPEEPTGRGPALEQLLDHLDPVFDGMLPANFYVWGPKGAGKSAVVTTLFAHLGELSGRPRSAILTTTRAEPRQQTEFVYLDTRTAASDFALSHAVLDALVEESVPKHGVGTSQLRSRLRRELIDADRRVLVAVDHLNEPETHSFGAVDDLFSPVDDSLSIVGIGRERPAEIDADVPAVRFPPYRHHALVDILTNRVSNGLARHALTHEQVREVAEWADGDAHDALAALFGAADQAMVAGHDSVSTADLDAGMDAVPRPSVSLGRVLSLPENRQRVLRRLLDLDDDERSSVQEASEHVSRTVDLSSATVKRILYELAESGITRRVTIEEAEGKGRPPSRLEPRFPTAVFKRLFALNSSRD
jgi:Cdc6-like AAA superfamily ATPase